MKKIGAIVIIVFLSLMFMPGLILAQDTDTVDSTNYETSPIYGNSSSRGVSIFSVPGQASIGNNSVSRFAAYSTDINDLPPIQPVQSRNPLAYSTRLPMSVYGSVPQMPNQVLNKMNTRIRLDRMTTLGSLLNASNGNIAEQEKFTGTKPYASGALMGQLTQLGDYTLRFSRVGFNDPVLNAMKRNSTSAMYGKKKVLLLGNRTGRLGYSRTDISRSLLNRATRVNVDKNKLAKEYSTSAILGQ